MLFFQSDVYCTLYICIVVAKGYRGENQALKNGSESWGKLLECTERGEACKTDKQTNKQTNTQTGLKPLGSLTFFCFNTENIVNKTICHKK